MLGYVIAGLIGVIVGVGGVVIYVRVISMTEE